jgi:sulfite reductase (NADPH) flavoprotein alpha-component
LDDHEDQRHAMTSLSMQQAAAPSAGAVDPWSAAPFNSATAQAIQRAIQPLDARQRAWLSGFLAGSLQASAAPLATGAPAGDGKPVITVLYGSQSGNCERLAKEAAEMLAGLQVPFLVLDMLDCQKRHLQDTQVLLVIVSTHGEGDPPDRARPFHELLNGRKAPTLAHLKYSVLALGDSSYEKFCETGRQFDARLASLGAKPFVSRTDCDVDFEAPAKSWMEQVVEHLGRELQLSSAPVTQAVDRTHAISTAYTRKNPFHAEVLVNQRLTARGAAKDVRHLELSLESSGIHYEPGDALGVVPRNDSTQVDELLEVLPYSRDTAVSVEGSSVSLRQALVERFDIGPVTRTLLDKYVAHTNNGTLSRLLAPENADALAKFIKEHDLIDLIKTYSLDKTDPDQFLRMLRPLAPRLYSIASSQRATPDEVHLTVGLATFEARGKLRFGVVSKQLADAQGDEATVPVYLHRNPNFRLPTSGDAPVIMFGPGTGIAPFRGFLAEREAAGARGSNWLFFGERNFLSDFLYQTEWLDYRKRGVLTRMDVAFSRDQASKIYVQHRMLERGAELYDWIRDGAYIYVCGDASRMAADVENALVEIIQKHGNRSPEQAQETLMELQRARRYQRDVY